MIPEGLSNKLIAEYNELASQHLDSIKVDKVQDFDQIKIALSTLLEQNKVETSYPALKEKIEDIKDLIDSPEIWVQDKKNYRQYQSIIKTRILAKINEIENMSLKKKKN